MKKDIHPEYVETQVTCTCGNTFTTRSTATSGTHPRRRLLAVPPLLHRQAEDPRHRRPRGPVRGPLRQEGDRQVGRREADAASSLARAPARPSVRRGSAPRRSSLVQQVRPEEGAMFEAVEGWLAEHAELERRLADARDPRRRPPGQAAQPALRRAEPRSSAPSGSGSELGERPRGRPRAGRARTRRSPTRPRVAGRAPARCRGAAAAAAGAARPRRRQGRDPRGQVGRGRRGVRPVRRRPAADVLPLRRAAGLEGRGARRHRVRPRRLQVGHGRGQGQGHARAGRGAVRAC